VDRSVHEDYVLVLQGGGALGAYQAGVFEALSAEGMAPNWVTGISIGAINCALIAGNAPERRVERLREFWNIVSSALPKSSFEAVGDYRAFLSSAAALQALVWGVPGFFKPRVPPAPLQPSGTPAATSYYDTEPLRSTLESLVEWERLNSGEVRLSVSAVNVRTGNHAYFDSAKQRIDVRHIMASGALPRVSRTRRSSYVPEDPGGEHRTVFQVDLFSARGEFPATIFDVSEREKDIRYSSRTRRSTKAEVAWRRVAEAVRPTCRSCSRARASPAAASTSCTSSTARSSTSTIPRTTNRSGPSASRRAMAYAYSIF